MKRINQIIIATGTLFLTIVNGCGGSNDMTRNNQNNTLIAFASNRDYKNISPDIYNNPYDIYTMNPDGTGQTRLTNTGADSPAFSKDHSKIAYVNEKDVQVYVMNADGTNQHQITTAGGYFPAFSPDGSKITFTRNDQSGNTSDIYIVNIDGSQLVQITNDQARNQGSSFSPDGKKILFCRSEFAVNQTNVYMMNIDGSNKIQLTGDSNPSSTYESSFPAHFSPDGKKIVFESIRDGNREGAIYTMNADGSNVTILTDSSVSNLFPRYSPEGTKIVFRSKRDGNWEIYTMNVDGSNQIRLTNTTADEALPAW
jgi:Tol biopolymer transport system component